MPMDPITVVGWYRLAQLGRSSAHLVHLGLYVALCLALQTLCGGLHIEHDLDSFSFV